MMTDYEYGYQCGGSDGYMNGYADARVKYELKWTKTEDRLPERSKNDENSSEWVIIAIHVHYDGSYFETCAYYDFSEKEWYTRGFIIGDVVAWMPIPKYEGVSE